MESISPIQGWRQYKSRYCLSGVKCKKCLKSYYPDKYLCVCGSTEFESYGFNGTGILVSFTNITSPPEEFNYMSTYCVGLIQLTDGPLIIAQLSDCKIGNLKIGMHVRASFRRFYSLGELGTIEYGIKFIPDRE